MKTPVSTYRLQLHAGFGFADARAVTDYLSTLGITHVYTSPILRAEKGSPHCYDIVDHGQLNPDLGTRADWDAWISALRAHGMGDVVDVVPNHMSTLDNDWWRDVLENGPCSLFADHFDIDWRPPKRALQNRVLLPVLGAQYGEVLEGGEISLEREEGRFWVRHHDRRFPLSPPSLAPVLRAVATESAELSSIVTHLERLPQSTCTELDARAERARENEVVRRRIAALCAESADTARAIDAELARIATEKGDRLDALLSDQSYRLANWRVATDEINYRRFFDVDALAAIRMEEDAVFSAAHALLFELVEKGQIDGMRLDHTDGLYDPAEYFGKLRARGPLYLVAEKILEPSEKLPLSWKIEGTTGYEVMTMLDGLWIVPAANEPFTQLYVEVTGDTMTFPQHVRAAKLDIMSASLASEVDMLAQELERIAESHRRWRDFTLRSLATAIRETIAAFPVYRTYFRPDGTSEPNDRTVLARALRMARRWHPEMSPAVFDLLRSVLTLEVPEEVRPRCVRFAMRFQQLTGPVMAKGVEDTACYRYVRFAALNEVGGRPDRWGVTPAELHAANHERLEHWPRSMTATSTHDTKRGEDVRARLAVLTEMPGLWRERVLGWLRIARRHEAQVDDEPAPSRGDQYLFLQTIVGAYPMDVPSRPPEGFVARMVDYQLKAAREAKVHTSWVSQNEEYEQALVAWIRAMCADGDFVAGLLDVVGRIVRRGATNGLAQVLLKICAPGVPDTYQGSETWNLSLVDPDNRRPVDYAALRELLAPRAPADLLGRFHDGRLKVHVVQRALVARRDDPALFVEGRYLALGFDEHVVAFAREAGDRRAVCVVPRQTLALGGDWPIGDVWGNRHVAVPAGRWRDAMTGRALESRGELPVAAVLRELPVALLLGGA